MYVCTYVATAMRTYLVNQWRSFKFDPLGVLYIFILYNHAHRPRLEKLLYREPSRSSNGHFKPLLDPGGGFTSETVSFSEVKRLHVEGVAGLDDQGR